MKKLRGDGLLARADRQSRRRGNSVRRSIEESLFERAGVGEDLQRGDRHELPGWAGVSVDRFAGCRGDYPDHEYFSLAIGELLDLRPGMNVQRVAADASRDPVGEWRALILVEDELIGQFREPPMPLVPHPCTLVAASAAGLLMLRPCATVVVACHGRHARDQSPRSDPRPCR